MRRSSSLPLPADQGVPRTQKGDWQAVATLIPYLWEYKGRVLAALACLIAAKVANVGVPAVLVEAGFLSKEETAKLESNDYREQMAAAISEGILRYRDVLKERQLPLDVTGPRTE